LERQPSEYPLNLTVKPRNEAKFKAEVAQLKTRTVCTVEIKTNTSSRFVDVYMKLLKMQGWNRIAALTEVGTKYTQYINDLKVKMESNKMDFIINEQFSHDTKAFMEVSLKSDAAGWLFNQVFLFSSESKSTEGNASRATHYR
jgi:hypothetical protein